MVKKSQEQLEQETQVSITGFDGKTVEVGTLKDFHDKIEAAVGASSPSVSTPELIDSKAYKAVVKHFGEDVARAIVAGETEIMLKNSIGSCQAKVFRATDEMEGNVKYMAAAEVVADFKSALREATAGDNAAIKLRRLKLALIRKG
jgi:hypothetical protein